MDDTMQWMNAELKAALRKPERKPPWQWAAVNIDYSRAANYDTPYRGPFDAELMPYYKQPLEDAHDANVREIVMLKASRCGYSENMLLTDLRYTMDCEPEPTLYVTGTMDLAKGFLDRRVKRGMSLSTSLARKYAKAKTVGTDIQMIDMDFRATWASSDTATKQDGWARIHADEVSLWGEFTVDMVRRRCAAYPFHHIIFGGSIDPTRKGQPEEDPCFKLYEESDRQVWEMPDPVTGNYFTFSLDGVKWSQDAKQGDEWELAAVESSAYYMTPDGTRIDEDRRMDVVRAGRWRARNNNGIRRGYKIVALMVPFQDCTFGQVAARFLSAKHRLNLRGKRQERMLNTLRTYFAEMWAEAHREEEVTTKDETLTSREADYAQGGVYVQSGWTHLVGFTCDVQKYHYWWLARAWSRNEKTGAVQSALIDWGNVASIVDLDVTAADCKPDVMGIDIAYEMKQTEVGSYCANYTDQREPRTARVVALRGSDTLKKMPIDYQIRDAYEGGRSAGRALFYELTWNVDVYRNLLIDMINGEGPDWYVPKERKDEERYVKEYIKQVTSTRKADGEWIVAGHRQDHLFDCEVMQVVLVSWGGWIQ